MSSNTHIFRIPTEKVVRFFLYECLQQTSRICLVPPVRKLIWLLGGAIIGPGSVILDARFTNAYHYGLSTLQIGKDCFIGNDVDLDVRGGIRFGNQVTVSDRVIIVSHINVGYEDHPLHTAFPTKEARVTLCDGCYIGAGAIILPGVTIGRLAVVGAGAVVTKNVDAQTVVAGVPAHVLKTIKK